MNQAILSALLLLSAFSTLPAQNQPVASDVYPLSSFRDEKLEDKKEILEGSTTFLESIEIHASTLAPGKASAGRAHTEAEELVIIKEGRLTVTQNSTTKVLGPGSIVLTLPGDVRSLENGGDRPVAYYVLSYKSKTPADLTRGKNAGGSFMIDREDIAFNKHDKGGIRRYFDRPTAMFERMEMHVTTLNAGLKSHDAHTHKADEIILLMDGKAQMQIGNDHVPATPGSLVFLNSMVPHALANTGQGPCEYFAFQWE